MECLFYNYLQVTHSYLLEANTDAPQVASTKILISLNIYMYKECRRSKHWFRTCMAGAQTSCIHRYSFSQTHVANKM